MRKATGVLTILVAALALLLATNVILAQPATPTTDPLSLTSTSVPPTFTDGRINPQAFSPVVLYCTSAAGGRLSGAQQVSGFAGATQSLTPTPVQQTPNENTVLTVYVLNAQGQGTLAWEFDFATGRLLVPQSSAQGNQSGQSSSQGQSGSGVQSGTGSGQNQGTTQGQSGSGQSATAVPTQSSFIPGGSFSRQSSVIAQANTPTPTSTPDATATQSGAATSTPSGSTGGTTGQGTSVTVTPAATVNQGGQSGQGSQNQNANRSVTIASGAGVSLTISGGRYIISAPQFDGKLYQFVFDGCPTVGDFDVLVNGLPTQ